MNDQEEKKILKKIEDTGPLNRPTKRELCELAFYIRSNRGGPISNHKPINISWADNFLRKYKEDLALVWPKTYDEKRIIEQKVTLRPCLLLFLFLTAF